MVAIGGIADIVQHWHEMARSRMTQSGHSEVVPRSLVDESWVDLGFDGSASDRCRPANKLTSQISVI
jgi:hypothetical protein